MLLQFFVVEVGYVYLIIASSFDAKAHRYLLFNCKSLIYLTFHLFTHVFSLLKHYQLTVCLIDLILGNGQMVVICFIVYSIFHARLLATL